MHVLRLNVVRSSSPGSLCNTYVVKSSHRHPDPEEERPRKAVPFETWLALKLYSFTVISAMLFSLYQTNLKYRIFSSLAIKIVVVETFLKAEWKFLLNLNTFYVCFLRDIFQIVKIMLSQRCTKIFHVTPSFSSLFRCLPHLWRHLFCVTPPSPPTS